MRYATGFLLLLVLALPARASAMPAKKGCCPHRLRLIVKHPPGSGVGFEILNIYTTRFPFQRRQEKSYIVDSLCGPPSMARHPCGRRTYSVVAGEGDFVVRWVVEWAFVQRLTNGELAVDVFHSATIHPKAASSRHVPTVTAVY